MPAFLHPTLLTSLLGCCLCGCSRDVETPQKSSPSTSAAQSAWENESRDTASMQTADHPCQLLTDAQIRDVFPGAAPGERDDSLDKYGIATCVWSLPTDRFIVQMLKTDSGSISDELRSRALGSVDPMMQGAADRVRYETVAGVGDEAMAIVEKADAARGILSDTTVLVMQRGERRAVLITGSALAGGERASALNSLEIIGRNAAARL